MTLEEYRSEVLKVKDFKIKKEKMYTPQDGWKWWYKHTKFPYLGVIDSPTFERIVGAVNTELGKMFAAGRAVTFPRGIGTVYLIKAKESSYIDSKTGELRHRNRYVNWYKTIKLWYEDPEAKEKKQLVYDTKPYNYIFRYESSKDAFKYANFFDFKFAGKIYERILKNVEDGTMQCIYADKPIYK